MKIFVGSDHRGFQLKKTVSEVLKTLGHEVIDVDKRRASSASSAVAP